MKVLFIGGNGNISWYCLKLAMDAGHEVYALNRGVTLQTRRAFPDKVIKLNSDIRNIEQTSQVLRDLEFDVVCDFICYNQQHAMDAIKIFKGKTKQYFFISSVTVYKRQTKYLPFKETTPQWQDSDYDYALSKICAEKVFIDAYHRESFPVTIVRPAHTYDTIIPVSVGHNCFTVPKRYIDGKPILIAGDGTNLWTLTHSRDFAEAFVGLFGNHQAIGEDFHITGDEWLNWLEITDILLDELNIVDRKYLHIPVHKILAMEVPPSNNMGISFMGKAFSGQRMWCDIYDNSKIKKFVPNWNAKILFRDGIKETINWVMEDALHRRFNSDLNNILEDITNAEIMPNM